MSYDKAGELVDALYEKTISGQINWEESEVPDAYQVSFPHYSVVIFTKHNEEHNATDYCLQIINEDGTIIETFCDLDFEGIIPKAYDKLKEIHNVARRQVLGVEEALDTILSNLHRPSKDDAPF